VRALLVDFPNKVLDRNVLSSCDFPERVPETILQAHTGFSAVEFDRPFAHVGGDGRLLVGETLPQI
jgi:hypothetical protein